MILLLLSQFLHQEYSFKSSMLAPEDVMHFSVLPEKTLPGSYQTFLGFKHFHLQKLKFELNPWFD